MKTFNELLAAAKDASAALSKLRHWHDSGPFNEGMIVAARSVRECWDAESAINDAIAAAEHEAAELAKPIDDEWLSKNATSRDRAGLYFGEHLHWSYSGRCFWLLGYQIDIANQDQLLSLLKGIGIEVAK